jgi:hypothetical protein
MHCLKQSLSSHRALTAGAATCYALIFGLLIYGIAYHAGLESWRQPPSAVRHQPAKASSAGFLACAEIAGMGRKLCNAEAKVDAARAKFQQRLAARKLSHDQPPAGRALRAQSRPVQASITPPLSSPGGPDALPHNTDPLTATLAVRE